MRDLYQSAAEHLKSGERGMLLTVLCTEGPVPRGPGTQMTVFSGGAQEGTVGGGSAEHEAVTAALRLMREGRDGEQTFSTLEDPEAAAAHGGSVTVHFLYLDPGRVRDTVLMEEAAKLRSASEPGYFVFRIGEDGAAETALVTGGTVLLSRAVRMPDVRPYLWSRPVYDRGAFRWFVMPVPKKGKAVIFGCGHVGKKLAEILWLMERNVTVADDRPELCSEERFPFAERICADPDTAFASLSITGEDEIIAMSRDPETDRRVMELALGTDAKYIGCIGSRKKAERIRRKLLEEGFSETQIGRIHAPVGLQIGAETPAEIAVSIVAEMIQNDS